VTKVQDKTQKLSIFLHKKEVDSFDACIKRISRDRSSIYTVGYKIFKEQKEEHKNPLTYFHVQRGG